MAVQDAEPGPHEHSRLPEAGEELLLAGCPGGGADSAAQRDAGFVVESAAYLNGSAAWSWPVRSPAAPGCSGS
ncbi:MAG: hypothetical protein ABSA03_02365 [Streptosporangiaceae bacterium]